ncbi:MAG: hypothetical protein L6R48_25100, partial [Planctomycetes bacterium]|nr:hypothetical protein [Planctomycetota bacterium]
ADAGGALVEARLLRRGDERLCWLLNMGDRPLAATVRVEAGDGLHALLVSEDAVLAPPAGAASWSAAALADGSLRLVLPAQRRVLLLLTPDGGAAARLGCTRTLAADAAGLAAEQRREEDLVAAEAALLATRVAVKPSRFEPSGIGRQVALPLAPEARDDLDAHPVLGQMFRHPQLLAGVQFACGQGPGSLLTLDAGHPAAHLDVNRTVRQLFVLHAAGDDGATGSYTIRFASGRSATIPLAEGVSIARLQLPRPVDAAFDARTGEDLRVAWVGRSGRGYDAALHALRWRNPTPEDAVAAIELRRDTGTVWVAAVTVETP